MPQHATNFGSLNPPSEAAVCEAMLKLARAKLEELDKTLCEKFVDRDTYARTFGGRTTLKETIDNMEALYKRHFSV